MDPIEEIKNRIDNHDSSRMAIIIVIFVLLFAAITHSADSIDKIEILEKRIEALEKQMEKSK